MCVHVYMRTSGGAGVCVCVNMHAIKHRPCRSSTHTPATSLPPPHPKGPRIVQRMRLIASCHMASACSLCLWYSWSLGCPRTGHQTPCSHATPLHPHSTHSWKTSAKGTEGPDSRSLKLGVLFGFGQQTMILRAHSWLSARGSILTECSGIIPGSVFGAHS